MAPLGNYKLLPVCWGVNRVFAGSPQNKFHRFWDLIVDKRVKITVQKMP
jgi:hypothetical protein